MGISVTVAICTWNRADILERTLARLCELRIPAGAEWELLVVNNNCTDHTDRVVANFADRLPIRQAFEPQQGNACARNRAVEEARGDLLLWTDDDVLVEPDWMEAYCDAATSYPDATFFGGRVIPWYEASPPRWLRRNVRHFGRAFALRDFGDGVRPLEPTEILICANMAVRLAPLKRYRFDPKLGRIGKSIAGCEDHELIARMKADGLHGMWVGNAVVRHFIPRARMTLSFVRRWWAGQAEIFVRRFPQNHPAPAGGVPAWLRRKYIEAILRKWFFAPTLGPRWAAAFFEAAWLEGLLKTCHQPLKAPNGNLSDMKDAASVSVHVRHQDTC